MEQELLLEKEGNLAWVIFNRPDVRNAMNWNMYNRLEQVCTEVDEDPAIKVVILRGAGGQAFVAGTDIRQFTSFDEPDAGPRYEERIDRIIDRIERIGKPTIALLEGFCVGGGAAIALACDFRYATPTLKFGIPIARTLGNCLSMANMARLMDLLGVARTKELLMLGSLANATAAQHAGLVSDVLPPETIEAQVREVAAQLASNAPLTLRAVKESIRRTQAHRRLPPSQGDDLIRACYTSDDFHGAVRAFIDKQPHLWSGT